MTRKLLAALFLFALGPLAFAACGDDDDPKPTSQPTAEPTVASLAVVSDFAAMVAKAFSDKDVATLVGLVDTTRALCVLQVTDRDNGPICPAGVAPGTSIPAFPLAGCQGGWTTDVEAALLAMTDRAGRAVTLARMGSPSPDWPSTVPYGTEVIVFEPRAGKGSPQAVALYTQGGRIVRAQNGCRTTEQFVTIERPNPTVLWSAP